MKKTLCIILAIVLLSTFLGGCIYDEDTGSGLVLVAVPYNTSEEGLDVDLDLCAEQGFFLVAGDLYGEIDAHYYYQWYRDGEPLGPRSDEWLMEGAAFYPPLAEDFDPNDPELPGPLTTPGRYSIQLFEDATSPKVLLELSVVVPSCSPGSNRSDVSVTIYGGWDGISVKAYVGGTEQETLYTARDAFGQPAVLWTLYPPAGEAFNVSIAPQTPPGKDPERWQYKLVRIEGPAPGDVDDEPESADVSVTPGGQYRLYFQLLDMGSEASQ